MNLEELEAQVIGSNFEREQLAVYADALQSSGNAADQLRGELVALDLAAEAALERDATVASGTRGEDDAVSVDQRRRELLASWLGDLAPFVRCEWGFVHLSIDRSTTDPYVLPKLLATPAGAYLRGLALYGDQTFVRDAMSLVAVTPRKRLARLAITQPSGPEQATIAGRTAAKLITATPALESLAVRGFWVFGAFPHPGLRTLRVAGWNGVGSLTGEGGPLPALEHLDFAFHRDFIQAWPRPTAEQRDRMLRGVPALRRLDLSRNDRRDYAYDTPTEIFGFLRELALKKRITHLRVPSIVTAAELADLQATIDRMPDLVELEIVRFVSSQLYVYEPGNPRRPYPVVPGINDPILGSTGFVAGANGGPPLEIELFHAARITMPPTTTNWIPRIHSRGRDAIAIDLDDRDIVLELLPAVKHLEPRYRSLADAERVAWDELWSVLDRLNWDDEAAATSTGYSASARSYVPAKAAIKPRVLEAITATIEDPGWRRLGRIVRSKLAARDLSPERPVFVQRAWTA